MSERTDAVLKFIRTFQQAYPGLSPTFRQIMEAVDIPSTSTVAYYIEQLTRQGEIELTDRENQHGMVLPDMVILSKKDAIKLGLDWPDLVSRKIQARVRLERVPSGR